MKEIRIKQGIVDKNDELFKEYTKDILKYRLLSNDEEKELCSRIKRTHNKRDIDKLVCANLRFVITCAKQYQGQGLPLMDLINEGNFGLIKAANMFDVDKGVKFISYAVWWIRQSILLALSKQARMIRIPISQLDALNKIKKAIESFKVINDREPSDEELEALCGIKKEKINGILNAPKSTVSVNTPIGEDGELIEVLPNKNADSPDKALMIESDKILVNRLLNKLSDREHDIVLMYFGIHCSPLSMDDIASKFGISNERVRQIKEGAVAKLKSRLKQ